MLRQYPHQFCELVIVLVEDDRDVRDLVNELDIAAATIYR